MKPPLTAWLDETPGETRGVIADGGGYHYVLSQFDDARAETRLEAVSVARIDRLEPNLKGAFVELSPGEPAEAFLPLRGDQKPHVGQKVEVRVVAEPREGKGATLRLIGAAEGEPRLLRPAPSVKDWLSRLAPGVAIETGSDAIQAGWAAVEEALGQPGPDRDLSVFVERTRAMTTVDVDYRPAAGRRVSPHDRLEANRRALMLAARTLRLRGLGGLVAVDLAGVGHDGDALLKTAKAAFGADPEISYGPVNRFGVMMVALPWRFEPLAERARRPDAAAVEATRRLRHALLSDTTTARVTARSDADTAARAAPLVARLGPRAHLKADDALGIGQCVVETD